MEGESQTTEFGKDVSVRFRKGDEEYPEGAAMLMHKGSLLGLFRLNDIIEIKDS